MDGVLNVAEDVRVKLAAATGALVIAVKLREELGGPFGPDRLYVLPKAQSQQFTVDRDETTVRCFLAARRDAVLRSGQVVTNVEIGWSEPLDFLQ